MISSNGSEWELHLSRGVQLGREGKYDQAIRELKQVVLLRPDLADGHFNLGVAYRKVNRQQEALLTFEKAVALRPEWPEALFNLGNSYRDACEREKAIHCFERAAKYRPGYLKALNNLANLYFEQGQLQIAENHLRRALASDPDYAEGLFNLGRVLRRQRKMKEAFEVTARAASLHPGNQRYQLKLAELQKQTGQLEAAIQTLSDVLRAVPANLQAFVQLATLLRDQKKEDEALELLNQAIERKQYNADVLWLRADIRRLKQQYDEALNDLSQVLSLDLTSAMAHNLQGAVLFAIGKPKEAIESYERALAIKPDFVEAHNNLGAALQSVRRYSESLAAFDLALRLKPDFSVARLNRALSLLRDGQFSEGWREFEWRFLCSDYRLPPLNCATWMGEPLHGRTILLRTEQGLGDTFQFIRYARLVKDCGGRVIVECQQAACELVSRCPGVDRVIERGAPLPHFDVHIPLMSLPHVFNATLASIPAETPYLSADPELVDRWKERLRSLGKLIVGVAWQGNKKYQADRLRSLPLKEYRPLGELPDVALVSIQKNAGVEQLDGELGFRVHEYTAELDAAGPFRDTAAIIASCDLVVTSDTAIAHLAGALGRPVWVALGYSADWRWLANGDTSPWYPTMRLYRQRQFGNWGEVFSMIRDDIERYRAGTRPLVPERMDPYMRVMVETSPGELLDKITILEIKRERIIDEEKRNNVQRELGILNEAYRQALPQNDELAALTRGLREVNQKLWDIEDEIRRHEQRQDFGEQFIGLARSVYKYNDRRAAIKRSINEILKASIVEVKSYDSSESVSIAASYLPAD